jgi:DNA-binding SARP family transcriptional activator
MARLSLRLFGPIEVALDGVPVTGLRSDKVRALLAYLAVEAAGPHRRERLAGLLWPERPERAARRSLRQALANLRQVIADHQARPPFLLISRQTIQFNPASDAWVDVTAFTDLLQAQAPREEGTRPLEQAVELYRGDLLEGFSVPDSAAFEEWALLTRERLRRLVMDALGRLVDVHQQRGEHQRALHYAWRQVELDPWREKAQRQLMRLLALSGQRGAALSQYETCCRLLAEELGVEPAAQTTRLYEQIRDGELGVPAAARPSAPAPAPPAFLTAEEPIAPEQPLFVARERELAKLNAFLDDALAGKGRVAFVSGEAGSGKTALLQAFTRRAQDTHPDLLVAAGNCNAHTGIGDSYLPFREVLRLLSGDVEAQWAAGAIGAEHARRLWQTLPLVAQALVEQGPDLIDTFVPATALLERMLAHGAVEAHSRVRLEHLVEAKAAGVPGAQQRELFQQYSRALQALARQQPLLLVLDDLQWADGGSINLLFHLGRELAGHRMLVIGAYRPEEVASGRGGERHPLQPVINELQRSFGHITVDVDHADGRAFVEALLDSEPNRLRSAFREMLHQQTLGHPLFTVELLRGMQERGDITQDQEGRWVEGPTLDWQTLPSRVEAVIAERIGRLPAPLQQMLRVASVEGEVFTAEVVASAQGADERDVVGHLSGELSKRHRLVVAASLQRLGGRRLSRYRFGHILFLKYLFGTLDPVERGRLHEVVGNVLERLYQERVAAGEALQFGAQFPAVSEGAVQLTRHFEAAGMLDRAAQYRLHAGIRAYLLSANDEAIAHFDRGWALLETLPDGSARDEQMLTLLSACLNALHADRSLADPEVVRAYARIQDLGERMCDVPLPLLNGMLWQLWGYHFYRAEFEKALELGKRIMNLAPRVGDPLFRATAHRALGEILTHMGEFATARDHLEHLIEFFARQVEGTTWFIDQQNLDFALSYQSLALWCLGYPDRALSRSQEAIALARDLSSFFSLSYGPSVGGAALSLLLRELRAARERLEAYVHRRSEKGHAFDQAIGELYSGRLQVEAGQSSKGLQRIQDALEAIRATGTRHSRSQQLACLVAAYLKAGQVEEGLRGAAEALAFVEETGERWFESELHRLKGELLRMDGDESRAEASFLQAIKVAREQQARSWELRATMSLYRLLQAQGRGEQVRQQLAEVYGWFTEGFNTPDLQEARALLNH